MESLERENINIYVESGFAGLIRRKALPWWEQNRVRQLISSTKTQKGIRKWNSFPDHRDMNRETAVQDTCRDAKVLIRIVLKPTKDYNYEIDERFCCTAAFEEADE